MADIYSVINSMNKSHSTHHIKICQEKPDASAPGLACLSMPKSCLWQVLCIPKYVRNLPVASFQHFTVSYYLYVTISC